MLEYQTYSYDTNFILRSSSIILKRNIKDGLRKKRDMDDCGTEQGIFHILNGNITADFAELRSALAET